MAANPAVPGSELSFETEKTPTETVVRCSGTIKSNTAELLRTTVKPLTAHNKTVVLDLTNVNYLDSSGLGTIVGLYVSTKRAGCKLKLINLSPRVKELFSLMRLAEVLEAHAQEGRVGITPE